MILGILFTAGARKSRGICRCAIPFCVDGETKELTLLCVLLLDSCGVPAAVEHPQRWSVLGATTVACRGAAPCD